MAIDIRQHPCFDESARHRFGRVHLPVAPKCNIGCNFCNRKYDCLNESRPGVTSAVLAPQQALAYLRRVLELSGTPISVVGIAGPGDPFASPEETMETLRLVRRAYPDMMLCVASNGLNLAPYADQLGKLQVSHVTITINAVDPEIGAKIYRFVRPQNVVFRGVDGAEFLLNRQLEAIQKLKAHGVTVKVNSIVMPTINDQHIGAISQTVAALGADVHNCMALYALPDTPFADLAEPDAALMEAVRAASSNYLPQMKHCQRCRADAVGLLGQTNDALIQQALADASRAGFDNPDKPYAAVASLEGVLINEHLGAADQFRIFEQSDDGQFIEQEIRRAPVPGLGDERWHDLAEALADCRVLLCSAAGARPKNVLAEHGIRVLVGEGLIEQALTDIWSGRKPNMPARVQRAEAGCDTDGVGCGGCTGSGTGCG